MLLVGLTLTASAVGLPYYAAPMAERVRHPFHGWLKPSGYIGQSAGILALFLFLFMWLYPMRKRIARLARLGRITRWLDIHIVAGLLVPFIGAIHAAWRFNGLIGLGYAAMLTVSLSGIVGRYLFNRIPRHRSGIELGLEEIESARRESIAHIAALSGIESGRLEEEVARVVHVRPSRTLVGIVVSLLLQDVARFRAGRKLRRRLQLQQSARPIDPTTMRQVVRLVRRQIAMTQQEQMLKATQRVFRFWHVAHLPFAVTALVAVLIHVGVVVGLGVTWLW
jgi:hypothetical protein